MKARAVNGDPHPLPPKEPSTSFLQGRVVSSNFSSESTQKIAKIGLTLIAIGVLIYWAVCDLSKEEFCVLRNSTDIMQNLNQVGSLF